MSTQYPKKLLTFYQAAAAAGYENCGIEFGGIVQKAVEDGRLTKYNQEGEPDSRLLSTYALYLESEVQALRKNP